MDFCCACGTDATRKRYFQSKCGKDKQMSSIFFALTGIEITCGFLCRSCTDKMYSINDNIEKFKLMCQKTFEVSALQHNNIYENTIEIHSFTPIQPQPVNSNTNGNSQSCSLAHQVLEATGGSDSANNDSFEHNYSRLEKKRVAIKKPKTQITSSLPPLSCHDHTYHSDSVSDMNIFKIPDIVRKYFSDDKRDSAIFSDVELKVLIALLQKRDVFAFVKHVLKNSKFVKHLVQNLSEQYKQVASGMSNIKKGFVSILMSKDLKDLEHIEWEKIACEFRDKFKLVFDIICSIMMPAEETPQRLNDLLPRIGLLYAIILQSRHQSLSLVQRLNSMLLMDNICDQKVYDRLQVLGITLSYQKSLHVLDLMGGSFNATVIEAVQSKKTIRIIGDNVNWKTMIKYQHASNEGKTFEMHHAFASAFLINDFKLLDTIQLDTTCPQRPWQDVKPKDFMLTEKELQDRKFAYIHIICKVVGKFIPSLSFMGESMPQYLKGEHAKFLTGKTTVIPLETLPFNEQKYDEVVQILDYYEKSLDDLHRQADSELKDDDCFHIGGDLLTRERFSGSKRLRANERNLKDRFGHLRPITFELFHLLMNFLQAFNYFLYDKNSSKELGTMFSELRRIKRTNFDPEVSAAYDADKDFIVSFIDVHIVEIVLEYFGMEAVNLNPTQHIPPEFLDDDDKKKWIQSTIGDLLDKSLFNSCSINSYTEDNEELIEEATILNCKLANGKMAEIKIPKMASTSKQRTDGIQNYAYLTLSLGLVFKELLDVCKVPDRTRLLRILKDCLIIFKAKSNLSKYALDIVRFLMQQTVLLSELQATESLYGMFVNTKRKIDSHIPADLQMEYLVKLTKKHIKHMFSNKSVENISKKTRSLASIQSVCDHFDTVSGVKVRCKKHTHPTYMDDELLMLEDLRSIRPFKRIPGREYSTFQNIKRSACEYLDGARFHEWLMKRLKSDGTDLGI